MGTGDSTHLNNNSTPDRSSVKVGGLLHLEGPFGNNSSPGMYYNCYSGGNTNFYRGTYAPSSGDYRPCAYSQKYGGHYFFGDNSSTAWNAQQQITSMQTHMQIDSLGRVFKANQPGFEASYPDAYNTSNSPSNYVTQWLRVHHNYGSHFNANTGYFTAPVDGRYLIGTIWTNVGHSNPHCAFGINNGAASGPSRGGTNYTELWHTNSGSGSGMSPVHIFDLSANDTVNVWIYGFTGTADDPRAYFFGYLLG
jgi:hypothetical protein